MSNDELQEVKKEGQCDRWADWLGLGRLTAGCGVAEEWCVEESPAYSTDGRGSNALSDTAGETGSGCGFDILRTEVGSRYTLGVVGAFGENEFGAFFDAIKKADVLGVRKLVDSGANVNTANKFGWTPLMVAAGRGNTPIIEILIAAGGDVNSVNDHGVSPLACAALDGHWKAVELLLKNGASVDVKPNGVSLLRFVGWNSGSCGTLKHFEILKKAGAILE